MKIFHELQSRLGRWKTWFLTIVFFLFWLGPAFFGPATDWADRLSLDTAQVTLAPFRNPDPRILMVNIDTATLQAIPHRWPWPRSVYLELCQRITAGNPRFLVIDILFQHLEGSTPSVGDVALAELFRSSGRVGLVSLVDETISQEGKQLRHIRNEKLFRKAAALEGFVWGHFDADYTIRSVTFSNTRLEVESCALQTARHIDPALPLPLTEIDGLRRGQLAFLRGNGGIPILSALDIFEGRVSSDTFKDRMVFLGVTAEILHDLHQSPLGVISGLEILATSVDSLLHRRLVQRLDSLWWRLAAVIIGGLLGLLLVRTGGRSSLIKAWGVLVLLWATILLQSPFSGFYPPLAPFCLAWLFCSLCWVTLKDTLSFLDLQLARAEAEAAGRIQAGLFPESDWRQDGYLCQGRCIPWESAGGDLFDIIPLPDGRLLCLVLDVAGHGFSAAMVTVMAKTVTTLLEQQKQLTPESLIEQINSVIFRFLKKKKHMTGVFALLTPSTGELQVISAGHLPSYLVRANGAIDEVGKPGYPLGMRAQLKVTEQRFSMNPGDTLAIYTDGIIEAVNWRDEQFGFERWTQALKELLTRPPGQDIFDRTLEIVQRHTAQRPFQDDVTLLFLHRLPTAELKTPNFGRN